MLAFVSLIAGGLTGLVAAGFRALILDSDHWRSDFIAWAHGSGLLGIALVVGVCASATATAAWLVRRFSPEATGSGIPRVEAVLHDNLVPLAFRMIPVKFVGGLLAMGSGLALGREGPSVQMGAGISNSLGRLFALGAADTRTLIAAGAGAGLATAFNAPVAGAVFVLEELLRRFDLRTTIATFGASAASIGVARALLGSQPDFHGVPVDTSGPGSLPLYLVFGVVAALLGVAYNRAVVAAHRRMRRSSVPVEVRAALIGATVGLVAWFAPTWVGGGDALTQATLSGELGGSMLILIFLARFGLGALSYSAGTPGGLFAPMLVLGSQGGFLFGEVVSRWFPGGAPEPTSFAVVGMAAFFTAVVRAPVTGIVLVVELTGSHSHALPMLVACFPAILLPTLLRDPPIYDSLREPRRPV